MTKIIVILIEHVNFNEPCIFNALDGFHIFLLYLYGLHLYRCIIFDTFVFVLFDPFGIFHIFDVLKHFFSKLNHKYFCVLASHLIDIVSIFLSFFNRNLIMILNLFKFYVIINNFFFLF